MGDVESGQGRQKSVIEVKVQFKSGATRSLTLSVPLVHPAYNEPLSLDTLYQLLVATYDLGEAPTLVLPTEGGGTFFADLNAVDYVEVSPC